VSWFKITAACVYLCFTSALFAQSASGTDSSLHPAAYVNSQLPKWLQFNGGYRMRYESQNGIGFKNSNDSHLLGQFTFGLTIHPVGWLTFFGQAQDARIFFNGVVPSAAPNRNTWDIHQSWVEFGGTEKYRFTLRGGRQELGFGEQRLVGPGPWLNSPRVFDAVLITANFQNVRVDAFVSSVVNNIDGQLDHHKQGNPFYGIYGTLPHLVKKASIEPYYFWRLAPVGYAAPYADGATGHLDEKTVGFRWAGQLPKGFDYDAEIARQDGTLGSRSIGAWAGHWIVAKTLATKLKPRILLEYNYASGNSRAGGNSIGTFDQLYPSGHDKIGETDQVGWRNIRDLRSAAEFKTTRRLAFRGIYHNYWLASATDGLYAGSGAVLAKSLTGAAGTHVGQELDAEGSYNWDSGLQFGVGYGHLFTGEFLNRTTVGKDYNYPYIMATYHF
jgi:hypothetical protein